MSAFLNDPHIQEFFASTEQAIVNQLMMDDANISDLISDIKALRRLLTHAKSSKASGIQAARKLMEID